MILLIMEGTAQSESSYYSLSNYDRFRVDHHVTAMEKVAGQNIKQNALNAILFKLQVIKCMISCIKNISKINTKVIQIQA